MMTRFSTIRRTLMFVVLALSIPSGHLNAQTPVRLNTVDRVLQGVLAHSFFYHRDGHHSRYVRHPRPAPYTYGFPASSHRWGWFGVHYYPRSLSHHGYNGDHWSWEYRRGY